MTTHELAALLLAQPDIPVRVPSAWALNKTLTRAKHQPYYSAMKLQTQSGICYIHPDDVNSTPNETPQH